MNDAITQPVSSADAEYEATFRQQLVDMRRLEEQMDQDHAEGERLKMEAALIKAETQVIKAHTEASLVRLQQQIDQLSKAA